MFRNVYAYRNTYVHVITVSELKKKKVHELEGEMEKIYGLLWSAKQKGRNVVIELPPQNEQQQQREPNSRTEKQKLEIKSLVNRTRAAPATLSSWLKIEWM